MVIVFIMFFAHFVCNLFACVARADNIIRKKNIDCYSIHFRTAASGAGQVRLRSAPAEDESDRKKLLETSLLPCASGVCFLFQR